MIVTCANCTTRFNLAGEQSGQTQVRCSRCQYTFVVGQVEKINEPPELLDSDDLIEMDAELVEDNPVSATEVGEAEWQPDSLPARTVDDFIKENFPPEVLDQKNQQEELGTEQHSSAGPADTRFGSGGVVNAMPIAVPKAPAPVPQEPLSPQPHLNEQTQSDAPPHDIHVAPTSAVELDIDIAEEPSSAAPERTQVDIPLAEAPVADDPDLTALDSAFERVEKTAIHSGMDVAVRPTEELFLDTTGELGDQLFDDVGDDAPAFDALGPPQVQHESDQPTRGGGRPSSVLSFLCNAMLTVVAAGVLVVGVVELTTGDAFGRFTGKLETLNLPSYRGARVETMRSVLYPTASGSRCLIIFGEVINQGNEDLDNLEIQVVLENQKGAVVLRRTSVVGTTDILHRLSVRGKETSLLEPDTHLPPGSRRSFAVIIDKPPDPAGLRHLLLLKQGKPPVRPPKTPPVVEEVEVPTQPKDGPRQRRKGRKGKRKGRRQKK